MRLATLTFLVPDYATGIDWFTGTLGFELIEDTPLGPGRRWVRVAAPGGGAVLLLAKAEGAAQVAAIGNQTGGRVFLFVETMDFARDHARMLAAGVRFTEAPRHEPYGTVAVFADPWGNLWDLIELARA